MGCTPLNSECPINFMKVISTNDKIQNSEKKYQVINISKTEKILYSNQEKNGNIIAEFRIDDSTPCISASKNNLNHSPYLLEKINEKKKCDLYSDLIAQSDEIFEKNFVKIDTISYMRLYNDNKITKKIANL